MGQGKEDNLRAARNIRKALAEAYGDPYRATDRDVQHAFLEYASGVDFEDLVKMWAVLAYPLVD